MQVYPSIHSKSTTYPMHMSIFQVQGEFFVRGGGGVWGKICPIRPSYSIAQAFSNC